jgi:hypothetical protein
MLVVYLFVCFVIVGFLSFLFLLSLFFFLYYQLYHHHLLIPTLTPFTLPPSLVPKSITVFPNNLFCPFSPTLSPCSHLLSPFSLNLPPDYSSLLYTHHALTNLVYQIYTTPTPCNPWHKHPLLQQQKYTQTHTRTTKMSSPCTASLTHPLQFLPPVWVPPYSTPQISTTSLINIDPHNSHCYSYYHQGVFYITYKLLPGYWT